MIGAAHKPFLDQCLAGTMDIGVVSFKSLLSRKLGGVEGGK